MASFKQDGARSFVLDRVPRLAGLLGRERGAPLGGIALLGRERGASLLAGMLFDVRAIKRVCIPDFRCGMEVARCDETGDMTLGDAEKICRFSRPNKARTGHSANCSPQSSSMSTFGPK